MTGQDSYGWLCTILEYLDTLEKNHSHTNVKHQIWRQGHRAQSYKLVGSHSRQRWTMNTLVTTQRINFLISGHPEIFETSTTKRYNLQITKLKIYLIVYHHMKLKSKTDKINILMNKMSYLILKGLKKAWGYFKLKCLLPLYFIFKVYMNILACWYRLTKIIFRALLNENCISKAVINALNLLECDRVYP